MTAAENSNKQKDYWSAETYSAAAGFVPTLTQRVLQYLDAQPGDRILDIGCGDGKFTANFLGIVKEVYGVDASPSFVQSAQQDYGSEKAHFSLVDCSRLEKDPEAVSGKWDKVISNAALHWILRNPNTRMNTLHACYDALRPGGLFVFEMGGAGNVAEVHAALISALYHNGLTMEQAREASPWFFPSDVWMKKALEEIGFAVEVSELEYRPTRLTTGAAGGMEGWVKLMGGLMLDKIEDETKRAAAVREVCDVLRDICGRIEDGSEYLGYVRLRCKAWKPE